MQIFVIHSFKYFQKQELKMLFDFHLVSLETSRPTGKEKFTLGLKMRLKMKPFDSGYVIGHSLERRGKE